MTEPNTQSPTRKELMEEIVNRKKMGDKKFHSESSLQNYAEDDEVFGSDTNQDPGVLNKSVNSVPNLEELSERKRTMSQPGPVSGSLLTASAARTARRRPQKNVMYAPELERSESTNEKPVMNGGDSGTATPVGDRNSPLPYFNSNYRNGDVKSLNSYRLYIPTNDMKGNATPRKRSVATMDAQSIRSIETHAPPPTSPEDNKKQTTKYVSLITSCMYAVLLVTLGLIIYLGDSFVAPSVSVMYSIILCGIGFLYHIYLIVDINRYKSIVLKNMKTKGLYEERIAEYFRKQEDEFGMPTTPGDRTPEAYRPPGVPPPVLISVKHQYCFSQGRHSGSFYLKLGAAGFALGHLVHSVLLLAVQIGYYFDEDVDNEKCVDILQVVLDVMSPCYCFLQLFFVFKYSNVIILRAQGLARFAFMHMIASSLCFWVSAIVRETILALTLYANSVYGNTTQPYNASDVEHTEAVRIEILTVGKSRIIDIGSLYNPECIGSQAVTTIFENFSPYLYPFSVEFNILIVAVYYIIWSNISHCDNEDASSSELNSTLDDNNTICKIPTANEDNDFTSNIVIHADCHASNKGLFLGLIVTVIITGMLIIAAVLSSGNFAEIGYLLNDCTKLALHTILLFGSVIAFNQMRKLDINEHPISLLDDVLLFICLPAFFMETVFSMIATISILNIVKTTDYVVMVIQILIQTPLIMDGLRRCSNTKKLRRKKPGREVLMFLLITNVVMWLFYTFSYKSPESLDERYAYYGKVAWSILGHVSLPLIMFYRFHSSVCFADIWNSAYKPGSEH